MRTGLGRRMINKNQSLKSVDLLWESVQNPKRINKKSTLIKGFTVFIFFERAIQDCQPYWKEQLMDIFQRELDYTPYHCFHPWFTCKIVKKDHHRLCSIASFFNMFLQLCQWNEKQYLWYALPSQRRNIQQIFQVHHLAMPKDLLSCKPISLQE